MKKLTLSVEEWHHVSADLPDHEDAYPFMDKIENAIHMKHFNETVTLDVDEVEHGHVVETLERLESDQDG